MPFVYFVIQQKYFDKYVQPLLDAAIDENGQICWEKLCLNFYTGIDCWVFKTWAILKLQKDLPFTPVLVSKAVAGQVCVFHAEHAKARNAVHQCFAVVAQADRPTPPLADMIVVQNNFLASARHKHFIQHWTQGGLIKRDPARNTKIKNIAFLGDERYLPTCFADQAFVNELASQGVQILHRSAKDWHNYADLDLAIAIRKLPKVVEQTKPASKLVNAWLAGVPAILSPELPYAELKQSELDYLEASNGAELLTQIKYLQANPQIYQSMIENGSKRAQNFTDEKITAAWVTLLNKALEQNKKLGQCSSILRLCRFYIATFYRHIWKTVLGFKD